MFEVEQRSCGWWYTFTDKQGTLQTRGPFLTEDAAKKAAKEYVR